MEEEKFELECNIKIAHWKYQAVPFMSMFNCMLNSNRQNEDIVGLWYISKKLNARRLLSQA